MKAVLIVEDNRHLAKVCSAALRVYGYRTEIAINGLDALDRLRVGRPDVIVLDIRMPIMDGRDFFDAIRDDPQRPPVLITTSFEPREVQQELGAEAFLTKPFDLAEFAERVRELASLS